MFFIFRNWAQGPFLHGLWSQIVFSKLAENRQKARYLHYLLFFVLTCLPYLSNIKFNVIFQFSFLIYYICFHFYDKFIYLFIYFNYFLLFSLIFVISYYLHKEVKKQQKISNNVNTWLFVDFRPIY